MIMTERFFAFKQHEKKQKKLLTSNHESWILLKLAQTRLKLN